MGAGGATLLIFSFCPSIAAMFLTGDFGLLIGFNIWFSLGIAFAVGLAAAITAVGSGLNTQGTAYAFVLAFATTLFVILSWNVLAVMDGMPYAFPEIITGFSALFFGLGVFFLASGSQA